MILATAHFQVRPGHDGEFVEATTAVIAATTAREPGCSAYACYRDVQDDLHFVFVEEWADMGAVGEHVRTDHYRAFAEVAGRAVADQAVTLHTVEKSRTV
jgi:quinol monooxygenase YgiN